MLVEGNLIYFKPFYFENGQSKNKYFLVLKQIFKEDEGVEFVLASLPSSKDYVPSDYEDQSGCIEIPERHINCYVFDPELTVTKCETFSFPLKTFIYGEYLNDYTSEHFEDYEEEGLDYDIIGVVKEDIFNDIITCLKNSAKVKNRYKKLL